MALRRLRSTAARSAGYGLADYARHVITHILDPHFLLLTAATGLADCARHVIIHILDPRFLI
jgi:hypothetical protein